MCGGGCSGVGGNSGSQNIQRAQQQDPIREAAKKLFPGGGLDKLFPSDGMDRKPEAPKDDDKNKTPEAPRVPEILSKGWDKITDLVKSMVEGGSKKEKPVDPIRAPVLK